MTRSTRGSIWRRIARRLTPLVALSLVAGCASSAMMELSGTQRLAAEARDVLGTDRTSPDYRRLRVQLEQMGNEADAILVDLVEDMRARTEARADALVLLAERASPIALPILSRALGYENERLRSAAVLGLNRLAPESEDALALIRAATRDRSRTVRLNALQSLDIREIETVRALLERETDPEVREIAVQLVSLAEARGAPLIPDSRGALRTAGGENDPQIVFRPFSTDSATGVSVGDLRLELPEGPDIPLAASARVVGNVVPAFFSADRAYVVFEGGSSVGVLDISTRTLRTLGRGLAPRLIPFTHHFVFMRERVGPRELTAEGIEIVYDVLQSSFGVSSGDPVIVPIGQLHAWVRHDRHGGESPVSWMVVGDSGDGFELRGDGIEPFRLPGGTSRRGRGEASPD